MSVVWVSSSRREFSGPYTGHVGGLVGIPIAIPVAAVKTMLRPGVNVPLRDLTLSSISGVFT